jgi:hypothetical protein
MRPDLGFLRRIAGIVALLLLLVGGYAGNAEAQDQVWHSCTATTLPDCTREIRIYNNAGQRTLYVAWQGSIQDQPALGCAKGDIWLQNAFNDVANCYIVTNTYLAYINPLTGIKPGEFVSIQIPWWSKTTDGGVDKAVDWWRASRIYIFDDQTALNESYKFDDMNTTKTKAQLAQPVISCTMGGIANNKCIPNELEIFRLTPGSKGLIQDHTPMQLNEFTIADIPANQNCNVNPANCTLNVNFNVSYVDHIYLPIAIGPIRTATSKHPAADIGYMGTTMPRGDFQRALKTFAGCDPVALQCNGNNTAPNNLPTKWPVFNNPLVNGQSKYPLAGVKLPSTLAAFNYYMFPGLDFQQNPILLPASKDPGSLPNPQQTTFQQVYTNWTICTGNAPISACPQARLYDPIEDAFNENLKSYLKYCPQASRPPYLQTTSDTSTTLKNRLTYYRFLHGWVEFEGSVDGNPNCTKLANNQRRPLPLTSNPPTGTPAPPLSAVGQSGATPLNYINLQYNWDQSPPPADRLIFNAYTRFIHGTLNANAYAFSIDDAASVMNIPANGLVLAVGGANGLENPNQFPPPLPLWAQWFMFNVSLAPNSNGWVSYSLCGKPEQKFQPNLVVGGAGLGWGNDPAHFKFPCTMIFTDGFGQKYQFRVLQAAIPGPNYPQTKIWPDFNVNGTGQGFDPSVLKCDVGDAVSQAWCNRINEVASPPTSNFAPPRDKPIYTLSPPAAP